MFIDVGDGVHRPQSELAGLFVYVGQSLRQLIRCAKTLENQQFVGSPFRVQLWAPLPEAAVERADESRHGMADKKHNPLRIRNIREIACLLMPNNLSLLHYRPQGFAHRIPASLSDMKKMNGHEYHASFA